MFSLEWPCVPRYILVADIAYWWCYVGQIGGGRDEQSRAAKGPGVVRTTVLRGRASRPGVRTWLGGVDAQPGDLVLVEV